MTSSRPPIVSLQSVCKSFDSGLRALNDVSLDISPGSFTSLIGSSGCGKSTLLRIVAGLLQPSSGTMATQGIENKGDIGYVFQDPTLMPWATVEKNVELPLEILNIDESERKRRVRSALSLVGLEEFHEAFPRTLSGGMKMRVSLARALASRPKILLLDEPFAALDELTRARLNDDLLSIWKEQDLTVLFVSHSVFESVYLSTRIVVMTPRPGRPAANFDLSSPTDRTQDYRLSSAYADHCRDVSAALHATMEPEYVK